MQINCEICGLIANSNQEFLNHKRECNSEFQTVSNKRCKYYVNGGCHKNERCKFSHLHEKEMRAIPNCRNGTGCRFLARGICSFFHRDVGVQQPLNEQPNDETNQNSWQQNQNPWQQNQKWCRFQEDCFKIPNCLFTHYEKDFPKLAKTNNSPWTKGSWDWQDY